MLLDAAGDAVERVRCPIRRRTSCTRQQFKVAAQFAHYAEKDWAWYLAALGDVECKRRLDLFSVARRGEVCRADDDARMAFPYEYYDFGM